MIGKHYYTTGFPESPRKPCHVMVFADYRGDQFTYKVWIVDKNEDCKDGREIT